MENFVDIKIWDAWWLQLIQWSSVRYGNTLKWEWLEILSIFICELVMILVHRVLLEPDTQVVENAVIISHFDFVRWHFRSLGLRQIPYLLFCFFFIIIFWVLWRFWCLCFWSFSSFALFLRGFWILWHLKDSARLNGSILEIFFYFKIGGTIDFEIYVVCGRLRLSLNILERFFQKLNGSKTWYLSRWNRGSCLVVNYVHRLSISVAHHLLVTILLEHVNILICNTSYFLEGWHASLRLLKRSGASHWCIHLGARSLSFLNDVLGSSNILKIPSRLFRRYDRVLTGRISEKTLFQKLVLHFQKIY